MIKVAASLDKAIPPLDKAGALSDEVASIIAAVEPPLLEAATAAIKVVASFDENIPSLDEAGPLLDKAETTLSNKMDLRCIAWILTRWFGSTLSNVEAMLDKAESTLSNNDPALDESVINVAENMRSR